MVMKLTARDVDALKGTPGKRVEIFDAVVRGLALRVTESGHKSWSVHYRVGGRLRRHTIGTVAQFTLAEARAAAYDAARGAAKGKDAGAEKKATRLGETIGDLAREYVERHAKAKKRSWADDQRMLDVDILPKWKTRKVKELSRRDVRELVEAIAERGAPITANRCLALIRKMLNFGIERDWLEANVAARIKKPGAEASRDRVLADDEIRAIWRCVTNLPTTAQLPAPGRKRAKGDDDNPLCPLSPAQAAIIQLRLLLAQRGGEVARMRRPDIEFVADDLAWWTIPGEHTKNKKPHRVPLVGQALAIVTAQIAANDAGREAEPADDDEHDDRDDREREYVFTSGETGAQDRAKKAPGTLAKLLGIDFRGHDLRRTAATKMREAGISREDVSRVLNHVEAGPRATLVYDRYDGDREKRRALETWERVLTRIITTSASAAHANVIPLRSA
jgi:integrase